MNLVLGPLTNCSLHWSTCSWYIKIESYACYPWAKVHALSCNCFTAMRKKRRLTIDFREMRSEFTEESIVNNGLLFMKNCFPYCLLEIIVGDEISRVATNLENMENSGNLKNCQNLRENLEKTQGNLNFWRKTWKTQGKCNLCGVIANKNLCNRFSLLSCSGKIWE